MISDAVKLTCPCPWLTRGSDVGGKGHTCPTKSPAGIKLAGMAERAGTVKPKALELWAEDQAWHELAMAP